MKLPFKSYLTIEKNIWFALISETAIQIINGCLMLILLLYFHKKGYSDGDSARFTAARFMAVLLISFPLGMYIKTRKLVGFFKFSSIALPLFTLLAVWAVEQKNAAIIYLSFFLWGVAFSFAEICKLPFILRYSKKNNLSSAIALSYATWSFGAVIAGVLIYTLTHFSTEFFNEKNCIITISILSFFGVFFAFSISEPNTDTLKNISPIIKSKKNYDWKKISYALTPTFLIAIGAGMSIPFVPLFFQHTFNLSYVTFAGYGFLAYSLVFVMTLLTPDIKNLLGYKLAIPLTQSISVCCLLIMGITELFSHTNHMLIIAILMYVLRQPLMSLAQPMTTELIMEYVGKNNHEMVSALMALIWNGSFVFTSILFATLRDFNINFFSIFLITAILYAIAIVWYIMLIKKHIRKS